MSLNLLFGIKITAQLQKFLNAPRKNKLRVGLCTVTVFLSLSLVGLVMNGLAAQLCVSQGGRSTGFLSPLTGLLTPL